MIDKALDKATGSLQTIADDAGISYDTLWAWKTGRRNPTPENLARLADALDRRGGELVKLAEALRKEAGE
jgi:transcriptional regulator with XRE-family HTH domain